MRMGDTVAVGWMDPGQVDGMFCLSIANLYEGTRGRVQALLRVENSGLLSRGRNEIVDRFLRTTNCQWLLMLDSDMQLDVRGFETLMTVAHDSDRPIVAGLYFGAWPGDVYPTPVPLIFLERPGTTRYLPILDYPDNQVIEIHSAGTGCLLVHRSVFEKFQADANPHQGQQWCWFQDMPINGDWFSEDHWFCARARELGFKLHAHTGVVLPHRKRFWLSDKQYVKPDVEQVAKELGHV